MHTMKFRSIQRVDGDDPVKSKKGPGGFTPAGPLLFDVEGVYFSNTIRRDSTKDPAVIL